MNGLMTHFVSLAGLSTAVGTLMLRLGVTRDRLEPRKQVKRCPSCGRSSTHCTCRNSKP
jgi:hypothetical protein